LDSLVLDRPGRRHATGLELAAPDEGTIFLVRLGVVFEQGTRLTPRIVVLASSRSGSRDIVNDERVFKDAEAT
jgi:hypothetical protein